MTFEFGNQFTQLNFEIKNERLVITKIDCNGKNYYSSAVGNRINGIFLTNKHYNSKNFCRYYTGSGAVGEDLIYEFHQIIREDDKQTLLIKEKNQTLLVTTKFVLFGDSAVVSVTREIENVSGEEVDVECANLLMLSNIMFSENEEKTPLTVYDLPTKPKEMPYLWRASNSWCAEGIFERISLENEGFGGAGFFKRCGKFSVVSNSLQSTCRYLPLGILERENYGYFMFELLPSGCWSYELECGSRDNDDKELTLAVTGKNLYDNGWYKTLESGERYLTDEVRFMGGQTIDALSKHFTEFRRITRKPFKFNAEDYIIYNNFQQNTFDRPTEESDAVNMNVAHKCGADYYVIDAGWHDSVENGSPTHKIGEWQENTPSYPHGLNYTVDNVRKKNMKFGMWVELQSVGIMCKNKDILPEDCYFHINGKRLITNRRYQLNYANPKTVEFAEKVIDSMVERYSPDYIKIDHNQNSYGTDCDKGSLSEGMAMHVRAYNEWFSHIQDKYPNVIFESCASGGMSLDGERVRLTNVFSVTDCGAYYAYPYILSNIGIAVLPEQNGIWNMPLRKYISPMLTENNSFETTDEEVIFNAVNSFYGVMHLASRLQHLSSDRLDLVKEGNDYYKRLSKIKRKAYPVFVNGFSNVNDQVVFTALTDENKLYLSVYNVSKESKTVKLSLERYNVKNVRLAYPKKATNYYSLENGNFECEMTPLSARSFEFELNKD